MGKLSAFIFLLVLVNLAWADVTTTSSPSELQSTESLVDQTTESLVDQTEEPVTDNENGSGDEAEDHTEAVEEIETTSLANEAETTAEVQEIAKEVTPKAPKADQRCSKAGVRADDKNCQVFHECIAAEDGSLHSLTKACPARQVFNSQLKRCSRDVSDCPLKVRCFSKGVLADPDSNTSYYLCQPRFNGAGYHVFHVKCRGNLVYNPMYGVCDSSSSSAGSAGSTNSNNEIDDALVVKQEIKEIKKEYKNSLKAQDDKKKLEEKAQKEKVKQAAKLEKQQAKLLREQRQQEAESFPCEAAGNYPSAVADNLYIACVYSKKKMIALPLECSEGAKFNKQSGSCVKSA